MTMTDRAGSREDLDAAEAALRQAEARVAQLRSKLADELAGQEARGVSARDDAEETRTASSAAAGREEARRGPPAGADLAVLQVRRRGVLLCRGQHLGSSGGNFRR
jgi:hypothetical protein